MPPHPALVYILLKFQAQLHQLTPNAIAQLSKYFWVVCSFDGIPSGDAFAKQYELHYHLKRIETDEGSLFMQYDHLNFHAKRDDRPKLSLAIKNKWSGGWTKAWFYCQVLFHRTSKGEKSVFALWLQMRVLDYTVERDVECLDNNVNGVAFVLTTATIGGRDAVKEFLACGMCPLASDHFLAKVETDAKNVLGSYGPREHGVLITAKLLNGGDLNLVFEQMGVPYAPCPLTGTETFEAVTKKRKANVSKNRLQKR
jgi:hypothetical protein